MAKLLLQALADRDQQPVAARVPLRVVDQLEAVDVGHQDRDASLLLLRVNDRSIEFPQEAAAAGQPGERVGVRQLADAAVGAVALACHLADREAGALAATLRGDGAPPPQQQRRRRRRDTEHDQHERAAARALTGRHRITRLQGERRQDLVECVAGAGLGKRGGAPVAWPAGERGLRAGEPVERIVERRQQRLAGAFGKHQLHALGGVITSLVEVLDRGQQRLRFAVEAGFVGGVGDGGDGRSQVRRLDDHGGGIDALAVLREEERGEQQRRHHRCDRAAVEQQSLHSTSLDRRDALPRSALASGARPAPHEGARAAALA